MAEDQDRQEFIDKQFNSMRAQLYNLVEISVQDNPRVCKQIKDAIKSITSHTWNNFTANYGARPVYKRAELDALHEEGSFSKIVDGRVT